ncbi:dedicator of cytokinesis protein 11-like isoform X1 [Clytia hemisphaerica]|uniref:Dedicator of cytokinesis protein 9 n=1 Tax=Clytia hemisphaerica TaxID=252671 RepID=A0A7M5VAG9_9CNID
MMKSSSSKLKTLGSVENEQLPPSRPMSSNDVIVIREDSQHEKRVNLDQQIKDLVTGVHPIDYEKELEDRRTEIKRDRHNDLLLFPDDDISLFKRGRELKTEYSTVPPQAFKDASNLLVRECLNVYTCDHFVLERNYKKHTSHDWAQRNVQSIKILQKPLYEVDVELDEIDGMQETMLAPTRENGIYKEGYLTKSPFHSDNNPVYGTKTYKRRWFTLKQTSNDGSYVLEYRKEEGSAFAKGTLYLDSCTQIRKGVKGRMYGFELHIQDKIYGLAADSSNEMDTWIKALCKGTGIEIEQEKPLRSLFGKGTHAKHKNLRESLKNSNHPLLQEYAKETDAGNAKMRQSNRLPIFGVYPELFSQTYGVLDTQDNTVEPFKDGKSTKFVFYAHSLKFKLNNGDQNCEPFFLTVALYDVKNNMKISEDFCFDLNDDSMKEIYSNPTKDENDVGGEKKKEKVYHCPKQCVFSVETAHQEIFLVLRINKVLQGGITACAEPYIKGSDNVKAAQKVSKQVQLAGKRLGKLRMPFGWCAKNVFKNEVGDLDLESGFGSIYKQESSRLTDDELLRMLQDLKNEYKINRTVIPGSFQSKLSPITSNFPNCYSPSLIPLKPFSRSEDVEASVEVQSFCPMKTEIAVPFNEYVNNFYIYPISLNYSSQKALKARNISCTIQFKDLDDLSAKPLKCLYQRNGVCTFTHQIVCPVLHHNTTPAFFEEIKILLPPQLEKKHHVLFTFHHVSVEQPKESKEKKKDVMTPVGYSWMAVLDQHVIRGDENSLPVALYLPESYMYSDTVNEGLNGNMGGKTNGPDIKWADGKGQKIFKVNAKLISTIYSQDSHINNLFSHWALCGDGRPSADVEMSRLLKLMHAVDVELVIKFLPVVLNMLFHVLIQTNNEDVAVNVVSLLIRITSMMHTANKNHFLKSYVEYTFQMESIKNKTVHEELAKNLIFYLRLGADPTMIANILQHSWFFFDVMVKSMAHSHMGRAKKNAFESRKGRFNNDYTKTLENLFKVFIDQLVNRAKEKATVVKEANVNLGKFIRDCLTHMDRGFVFEIVNYLKDQYNPPDTQMFELKFELLRCISEHEHFVPLNFPFDIRKKGDVHESTLNDYYCKRHFLVGVLLREFSNALYQPKAIRKYALRVLRNLLAKHEFDERYIGNVEKQSRIAGLYIPYLTMMLEHSLRFHKNLDRPKIDDSLLSIHRIAPTTPSHDGNMSPILMKRSSTVSNTFSSESQSIMSLTGSGKVPPILPFEDDEAREFLLCFSFLLKNLHSSIVVDWWREILTTPIKRPHVNAATFYYRQCEKHFAKFLAIIDFFDLLEQCVKRLKYNGSANLEKTNVTAESTKQFFENKYASLTRPSPRLSVGNSHRRQLSSSSASQFSISDYELEKKSLLEANLANEVAVTVLDMIELFITHFKFHLEQDDGDNVLMKKLFNVLMTFLRIGQSEEVMKYVFASLRSFMHKFSSVLFHGSANVCGVLCYEILRLCNSKIESVRTQACCFMYLLMRSNYEFSGKGCARVHHQVIVAVSKLIAAGMNRHSMLQSLIILKNYSVDDKGMKSTEFPAEVRDLIKKVHTVLLATAQMKEHEDDHEVLVDLQYSLAKSYSSTPELRQTWLQSMALIHEKHGDYSESAMCYIHSAALVAEYLKSRGEYPGGSSLFRNMSSNIVPDESLTVDDGGDNSELIYRTKNLIDLLEVSADRIRMSERYELMGEIYKIAIPLYELERNFPLLAIAYGTLKESYEKVVAVMETGKRMLGRYYRVAFYGRVFKSNDGKEFIYKEPKLTSLPEISQRLNEKYDQKYGNVKLIMDSAKVKPEELNPAVNYIQVTFVEPYFDEDELKQRVTAFERENNIRRFVFETPFTLSGKARGSLSEQHKRKTILTTSHSFPYVKKRILVVQQEQYELSPIEVKAFSQHSLILRLDNDRGVDFWGISFHFNQHVFFLKFFGQKEEKTNFFNLSL